MTCMLFALSTILSAQPSAEQRIEDSIIGWWDNNHFDNALKPTNDPVQKKRIALDDLIVSWMKKTYTPVAGLGTVTRQNFATAFGVYFMVWNVSFEKPWLDSKGHFRPIDEENTPFGFTINRIPGSYGVPFLNGKGDFYFTWPPDGYGYEDKKEADPKIHPNVYKFITRINEVQTVYLAPHNQLPFVPVTKGEYLDAAEASLDKDSEKQKEMERYRNAIHQLREKYKDHLTDPAILHNMQPTIIGDFFGDMDPFVISNIEREQKQYYPLYKVPAEVLEKCRTAQPQWIAVWFRYQTKESGNQLFEMYQALTGNLNYEYIYNYFFDTLKVKGIPYTPANEDQLNARLQRYRKKSAASAATNTVKTTLPPNVVFMDDFSGNSEGEDADNWFYKKYGKHSTISLVKNQSGKWLQLGYSNPVSPLLLKKPLPQNFTLEYDLATDGAFSSRTGGSATLVLNSRQANPDGSENNNENGTRVSINIQSGNEEDMNGTNYRGNIAIGINSTPSVNKENFSEGISYNYPLREFTNKKKVIHVGLRLKDNVLTLFINNKQVAVSKDFKLTYGGNCISCGVPAGTKFNAVFWTNTSSDADNTKVYISNVKISKDQAE